MPGTWIESTAGERGVQPPLSPALHRHTQPCVSQHTAQEDHHQSLQYTAEISSEGNGHSQNDAPLKRGGFFQIFQSLEHFQELSGP